MRALANALFNVLALIVLGLFAYSMYLVGTGPAPELLLLVP